MREFCRIIVISALFGLLSGTEALGEVTVPVGSIPANVVSVINTSGNASSSSDAASVSGGSGEENSLSLAEKAALEGKTLLTPPTYAYISDGWLYWGGQEESVGVSVEFIQPESTAEGSSVVGGTASRVAGSAQNAASVIRTGNDPVDVYRITKKIKLPSFRIRCIPEYNQRLKLAASEWLEPEDITVDKLAGLGLEGWAYVPGKWYFFVDGKPHKGWLILGNKEYYMDTETGVMASGWICNNEKWYYFAEETGELVKDGVTPDGYEVDKAGAWTGRMVSPKKYPWQ